ncbi:RagB/SusD family nutrient uptake outer membrane protein [Pontibacter kalidii]|uniref:RagB/SusD family nutrient uptake outer membrane protein n=1 Tax=Pontibacter kalidii TaxID=2592049 RepID=UPI002250569B|nr:RagB/SusD family nutrient uptake outer membrane protein [Pontibacter kalidii]
MKRSIKYLTYTGALAGLLLTTACNDDFLERPPQNQISDATFWKTKDDLSKALNAVYSQLTREDIIYDDGSTDNAYAQYPWESTATVVSAGTINTNSNAGWGYTGIRRANQLLENADKIEMDADLRERFKAEARFLRAWFYWDMVVRFGDVPLVTSTLGAGEEDVPRTPRTDVVNFLLAELSEIAETLPVVYGGGDSSEKGRVTKGAALALKARILLNEASPRFNAGDASKWKAAADAAQEVMGLGYTLFKVNEETDKDLEDNYATWVDFAGEEDEKRFRLGLRSYEKLFQQQYEGNSEVILDHQFIMQVDPQWNNTYLPPSVLNGWSSVTPTQDLVNAYSNFKTGGPANILDPQVRADLYLSEDPAFANEYKNRDPRFYASIMFNGNPWNALEDDYTFTWQIGGSNNSQTGYNFRKLVDPQAHRENIANHANIILLRYAEVLLSYAEAMNEYSGPDATVYAALNEVRQRAGMPPVDEAVYNSKESLRELIRNERRIELALEGQRYMDIRRWEIAPEVMGTIYDIRNKLVQTRTWYDKLYLMPVPQSQIDLSDQILTQNPGY